MSIVGTRPPLISETNLYEPHHKVRLAIKPGITGMWQVSGRSDITDFEKVVRWLCVLTGFICSCSIEIAQHITQTGYLQLDDVVTNTTGTLLGWSITANIDTLKADLKEKKTALKKAEKEVATLEAKKAKADAKAAEEAKKIEAGQRLWAISGE